MPEKSTIERAKQDAESGKSPSTQAGEFVREEIHHVREGVHGARSAQQAIAIGLSKARRAGIKLRPPKKARARVLFDGRRCGTWRKGARRGKFQRIVPGQRWLRCSGKATALSLTANWQRRRDPVHAGAALGLVIARRCMECAQGPRMGFDAPQQKQPRRGGAIQDEIFGFLFPTCQIHSAGRTRKRASNGRVPTGVTAHGGPSGPLQFGRFGSHPRPWRWAARARFSPPRSASGPTIASGNCF
jgi:hypothetical protein